MKTTTAAITLLVLALLAGCGSLAKPYPDKTLHAIHVGDPPTPAGSAAVSPMVLRVDRVVVAEPYDATLFVYQVGESSFKSDYYNGFIALPSRLLTGEVNSFLAKSGLFKTVLLAESAADYQLSLETNVTSMYGDYRDGHPPAAVLAARFFVVDQAKGSFTVIFDKTYTQSTPIEGQGPEALVKAYETAWTALLTQLAGDLRNTTVVMNRP